MNRRPQIKVGDIVKLSKKGRRFAGDIPLNATFRVIGVVGGGTEWDSMIEVKFNSYYFEFRREELWKTGFNINDVELELSVDAPLNNNGRDTCYICDAPTTTIQLLVSNQQICTNSNCKWFEN